MLLTQCCEDCRNAHGLERGPSKQLQQQRPHEPAAQQQRMEAEHADHAWAQEAHAITMQAGRACTGLQQAPQRLLHAY
jgi:hypothetical protein